MVNYFVVKYQGVINISVNEYWAFRWEIIHVKIITGNNSLSGTSREWCSRRFESHKKKAFSGVLSIVMLTLALDQLVVLSWVCCIPSKACALWGLASLLCVHGRNYYYYANLIWIIEHFKEGIILCCLVCFSCAGSHSLSLYSIWNLEYHWFFGSYPSY